VRLVPWWSYRQQRTICRPASPLFFLLLQLTGAGDELQGMKKGIMEIADAIFINKADGDNKQKALTAKEEYNRILHYIQPATQGWVTEAHTCSALTGDGIRNIWDVIGRYKETTMKSNVFETRRQKQALEWMYTMIQEQLKERFYNNEDVKGLIPAVEKDIIDGKLSATLAVNKLLEAYDPESKE